jgi:glyoxylase-like metal-dependent hydrolase (beta-lactamase superfamily II)
MKNIQNIAPALNKYLPGLYLVDLDIPQLEGFREFISCWVYKSDEITFVVDPGPSSTIPVLIRCLETLQVVRLDYILLTHIHLDHCGGTGHLLKKYPHAKVNCHPRGIPHLVEPQKLWEDSLKVLGKIAEAYGPVKPIPQENISFDKGISVNGKHIDITETPGHASHHICYQLDDLLFAAEVAGVSIPVAGQSYQRIATPPRFIYELYNNSLLKAAAIQAKYICFGHHGMRDDLQNVFNTANEQLKLWMEIIQKHSAKGAAYREQAVFEELCDTDPALTLFGKMDRDIQSREKYFCLNSIRGMYGYFNS